ncbi:MAG: hypothetical protein HRU47_07335 [Verrucomicrobiales bacterium]|nr:hypothetical protein [Verrucomicrobiales bacterium]
MSSCISETNVRPPGRGCSVGAGDVVPLAGAVRKRVIGVVKCVKCYEFSICRILQNG